MLQVPYTRTEVVNFTHIIDVGLLWQNFKTVHNPELSTLIKTMPGDKEISHVLLIRGVQRGKTSQGKENKERLYRQKSWLSPGANQGAQLDSYLPPGSAPAETEPQFNEVTVDTQDTHRSIFPCLTACMSILRNVLKTELKQKIIFGSHWQCW